MPTKLREKQLQFQIEELGFLHNYQNVTYQKKMDHQNA